MPFFIVLQAAILFLTAGRLDWTWAWVYLGICLASVAINGVIIMRTSPETVAERGRPQATQGWDKVVGWLWGLILYIVIPPPPCGWIRSAIGCRALACPWRS